MRQKVLIITNTKFPSLPEKAEALKKSFAPKIELEINIKETSYMAVPFTNYGTQTRIDDGWFDKTIVPLAQGYDVLAFVVPPWQWKTDFWGVKLISPGISKIQIRCDESVEPYQTAVIGQQIAAFLEIMSHELAHHFYSLSGQPDRTHEFVEKYKPGGWLPYFFEDWKEPVEPGQLKQWLTAIVNFIKSFSPLSEEDEKKILSIPDEITAPRPEPPKPEPPKFESIKDMVIRVCKEEGLDDKMRYRLFKTIECESGFNPKAKNKNKNGTIDYGIIQANDYWYIGKGKPIPSVDVALNDPEFCVRVMAKQFKKGKMRDWICYRQLFEK